MIIQCRRSSAWESTRLDLIYFKGEAEDRAVVSSNLTDGIESSSLLIRSTKNNKVEEKKNQPIGDF